MPLLRLFLLGSPRVEWEAHEIVVTLRRSVALLAYITMSDRPPSRETLCLLLWPDADQRDARSRLRRTLHRTSELLSQSVFLAQGEEVRIDPSIRVWVDARELERQARAVSQSQDGLDSLARTAALYQGDFMSGFSLPDSATWEDWQFQECERFKQIAERLLEAAAETGLSAGEHHRGVNFARRRLEIDRLNESAHRQLMQLYAASGQQSAALRQFQQCVRILAAELGTEPEEETVRLHEAILHSRSDRRSGSNVRPLESRSEGAPALVEPFSAPNHPQPIGRDAQLDTLRQRLDAARGGQRQIVFITGEAGMGKTSLVQGFLSGLVDTADLIGWGQCQELHGSGEPYLPLLEALGRLAEGVHRDRIISTLAQRAPTWLVQMPWLLNESMLSTIQQRILGATRERMLREADAAIRALTVDATLILVLEDLHWADVSTVDLLAHLGLGIDPARLLVLGTYRAEDATAANHPILMSARQLTLRGPAVEITLHPLDARAVELYTYRRLAGSAMPSNLAALLHRRTEGHPLFMVGLIDAWLADETLARSDDGWIMTLEPDALEHIVPDTVRQLIEQRLARLRPDALAVLEVASVAGEEFHAATVAAGAGTDLEVVEATCHALVRSEQLLRSGGSSVWPDGTVSDRFVFTHQLYKQVIYEQLPGGRAARLHRSIGERLEHAYASLAPSQAAELAWHYSRGFDAHKAVTYLELAAEQALSRSAHREAVQHIRAALNLLQAWPEDRERNERELMLQTRLASALIVTQGWSSTESEEAFKRGLVLCESLPEHPMRHLLMFALGALYEYRAEYHRTQQLMEARVGRFQGGEDDASYLIESHGLLACSLFHQGKFTRALEQAGLGLELFEIYPSELQLFASYGEHPAVQFLGWEALALAFLGRTDEALACAQEALRQAEANVYSLASAQSVVAWVYQLQGVAEQTRLWAESSLEVGAEHGFPYRVAVARVFRGWALTMLGSPEEGLENLNKGLASIQATGAMIQYPYFLALQADAYLRCDEPEPGLAAIGSALGMMNSERTFFYEPELHRLYAELLMKSGRRTECAELSLERALEIARAQGSKILEDRVLESLERARRLKS